jgi:hypothetical protein
MVSKEVPRPFLKHMRHLSEQPWIDHSSGRRWKVNIRMNFKTRHGKCDGKSQLKINHDKESGGQY